MKMLAIATAAAVAMTGVASGAWAQDVEPKKRENVTTYRIVLTNVNPGQNEEWQKRWKQVQAIEEAAGVPKATLHHMMTGDYGLMIMIPMPEGMGALDWELAPSGAQFDNAAIEMMGKEEFEAWQAGWPAVLERPKTYFSHVHD